MENNPGSSDPIVQRSKAEVLALLQRQLVECAMLGKALSDAALYAEPHEKPELLDFSNEMLKQAEVLGEMRARINARPINPLRRVK